MNQSEVIIKKPAFIDKIFGKLSERLFTRDAAHFARNGAKELGDMLKKHGIDDPEKFLKNRMDATWDVDDYRKLTKKEHETNSAVMNELKELRSSISKRQGRYLAEYEKLDSVRREVSEKIACAKDEETKKEALKEYNSIVAQMETMTALEDENQAADSLKIEDVRKKRISQAFVLKKERPASYYFTPTGVGEVFADSGNFGSRDGGDVFLNPLNGGLTKSVRAHEMAHKLTYGKNDWKTLGSDGTEYKIERHGFSGRRYFMEDTQKGFNICDGLNEGATELLSEKLMGHGQRVYSSYQAEKFIASQLCELVGQDVFFSDMILGTDEVRKVMDEKYGENLFFDIVGSLDEYQNAGSIPIKTTPMQKMFLETAQQAIFTALENQVKNANTPEERAKAIKKHADFIEKFNKQSILKGAKDNIFSKISKQSMQQITAQQQTEQEFQSNFASGSTHAEKVAQQPEQKPQDIFTNDYEHINKFKNENLFSGKKYWSEKLLTATAEEHEKYSRRIKIADQILAERNNQKETIQNK